MTRPVGVPADEPAPLDVAALTRKAVQSSGGVDPALLDGYLEMLAAIAAQGRRPTRHEIDSRRALGVAAAGQGVPLGALVGLYLSATWVVWRHLPGIGAAQPGKAATTVLRAVNEAVVALTDGYESAQRLAIRHDEALRREFIDDLLHGTGDPGRLPERAGRFGLRLAGSHTVAVARAADTPFNDDDDRTRRIGSAVLDRYGVHNVLVATKEGQLVCVAPEPDGGVPDGFAASVGTLGQVGIGRPHAGPGGVAQSYREACDVLDMAGRLGLESPVLRAADLLVFQVLFRDRAALTDLVGTVLGPLRGNRGGAEPLLETLSAYFSTGNAVAAARQLHLGVRTVAYRLQRVRELTGHHPTDPAQRFTLETAVLGARLLRWPGVPLDGD